MGQRVNEDIRFYLPADPYYYQVDNLPLEDLLANDVRLQSQIDEINSTSRGTTVNRSGFTELQPFVDAALPGRISVRAGNFIGRVQRTSQGGEEGGLVGSPGLIRLENGTWEINIPPTTFGSGENPTGNYAVSNPPNPTSPPPGKFVGRNAVFNFPGGNISIDAFNFSDFDLWGATNPPLGRLDLIGITTMNGAMDDPYLPGNIPATNVDTGDGTPKLAVVKGAGITTQNNGVRQVVIGEKYITVGLPQQYINEYGRNLEGNVVPNPQFGTTPMPDDVVNANFARTLTENGEIAQTLYEYAYSNKNANFFLPLAYVFVPQSHVEGNPIPESYLRDIRPFFRTAELALAERQAVAGSVEPSIQNPFTTTSHATGIADVRVDLLRQEVQQMRDTLANLQATNTVLIDPIDLGTVHTRVTFNSANYGIPPGAYAVILRGELDGDIDNSNPVGYVRGAYVDTVLVRASGASQSGRDSRDVSRISLPLPSDGTWSGYTSGAKKSHEYMRLFIEGYITTTDFFNIPSI